MMMRPAALALSVAAIALSLATPAAAERTLALVIGIDAYEHIPDLAGAVNDARDIADALESLGAETVLLTDAAASRDAIITAWTDLAARAGPGDRLIISYAGHGSNEVEAIAGEEDDGRDENWLLSGFSPFGAAAGERIRDNEIAALIALSPGAQVILVSDSCHSGTVSRDISPVLGYRYFRTDGTLVDDPLPPPPPRPTSGDEFAAVTLYFGAVPDSEKVPEVLIDNQARGALSHAFAAGLRGAADADGDGIISAADLEIFVRAQVRETTRGLQRPQIAAAADVVLVQGGVIAVVADAAVPGAGDDTDPVAPDPELPGPEPAGPELPDPDNGGDDNPDAAPGWQDDDSLAGGQDLPMPQGPDDSPRPGTGDDPAPPQRFGDFAALPLLSLSVQGQGIGTVPDGVTVLPADTPADLVLDPATGALTTMIGDLFTQTGPATGDGLQGAVDNARVAAALTRIGSGGALSVAFAEGDGTYRDGDIITVTVPGRSTPHLALFNISPDGTVTPLYPLHAPQLGLTDPAETPPASTLDLALRVGAPYGSDFLLAVETTTRSAVLSDLLADPLGSLSAQGLWAALQEAEAEGAAPAVAVFPFHSLGP